MQQKSIQSVLRETFLSPDKEVWKQFASQELEGKSLDEILSWNTQDGIRFLSYYDASDEKKNVRATNFQLKVADDVYFGPLKWLNAPSVSIASEKAANQTALQHLTNGADAIVFDGKGKLNLDYLLEGINWRYCALYFSVDEAQNFVNELNRYVEKNKLTGHLLSVSGGLFWETFPNFKTAETYMALGLKTLLSVKSSTPVQEIADALSAGVRFIEESNNRSIDFFKTIGFSMQADNSFLETIAKFKALRFLWFQVSQAYGHRDFHVGDLHVHARSEKWINEKFQPHGNLLRGTFSSMAAVLGGANAVTVEAEDANHPMMNRIARNVSNLLREESHLDKVADPSAGAYAIDEITEQFARRAWEIFQNQSK